MPSKNNKRKLHAEKKNAEKLAAGEQPSDIPENTSNLSSAKGVISNAPTSQIPNVVLPSSELSALAISNNDSSTVTSTKTKPSESYKPPTPLERLKINKPFKVITNSYKLTLTPTTIFRYFVMVTKHTEGSSEPYEYAGAEGGNRQRQAYLSEFVKIVMQQEGLKNLPIIYDGATTLHSSRRIENEKRELAGGIHLTINSNDLPDNLKKYFFKRNYQGRLEVSIEINSNQPELNISELLNESLDSASYPVTQMSQIALSEEAKQNGFLVTDGGSEMFDQRGKIVVNNKKGVEELYGIGAGIKVTAGKNGNGVGANVILDYKTIQFFISGPLKNLQLDWNNYAYVRKFLKGLFVSTTYSDQVIKIDGISNCPIGNIRLPNETPLLNDCARLSKKRDTDFNANWPAIQAKVFNKYTKKADVFSWPIENLIIMPNQKLTQKHGNPPRSAKPQIRFDQTKKIGETAHILSSNNTLKAFGISVIPNPIIVDAVTVSTPIILYKGGMTTIPSIADGAKWNVQSFNSRSRKGGFIEAKDISKIIILYNSFADTRYDSDLAVKNLKENLLKKSFFMGFLIKAVETDDIGKRYPDASVEKAIELKMNSLKLLSPKPIVMYADASNQPTHGVLKLQERLCEIITQQVSLDKSLEKLGGKTMENILMKLNLKNEGLNHKVIVDPMISKLWGEASNSLVISYDVCHSSGRVYKKGEICEEPSCVGFGYNGAKIPEAIIGDFHYQVPRQEQVDESVLSIRAKFMLEQYFNSRNRWPDNVIILRDGVSEGQHKMVCTEEFPVIQKKIIEILNQKKIKAPSFALLVVTKRHANRLYVKGPQEILNVPPLTAIDEIIVKKNGNEMIFVSHCPINGTAQPIVINMLHNDGVFKKNDQLVQFMATLCCSHQSSTTIVSLPETIYAADSYAKRGADLFQTYKLKCTTEGVPLPKTIIDGQPQIDYLTITKTLCYQTSNFFRTKRIA